MKRTRTTSALCGLVTLVLLAAISVRQSSAGEVTATYVSVPDAPFTLLASTLDGGRTHDGLLWFQGVVLNAAKSAVSDITFEVVAQTPAGTVVADETLTPVSALSPGGQIFFLYVAARPIPAETTRILVSPSMGRPAAETWVSGASARDAAVASFPGPACPGERLGHALDTTPPEHPADPPTFLDDCMKARVDAEDRCEISCNGEGQCGVASFLCTCTGRSFSYTCTCKSPCGSSPPERSSAPR